MYKECAVEIPKDIARVMLMSLISDTSNGTKKMTKAEWIIDFVTHPGVVETVDRINDIAGYYLVEKGNRQYFVKVTKDFITTRELPGKIDGKRFVIGNHRYTKGYQIV